MKRRSTLRLLASIVILAAIVYGFLMRTGRYQLTRLDATMYVVIDTSTGAHWVYRGDARTDKRGQLRIWFKLEDRTSSWSALKRLYPERSLDDWVE